MENNITIHYNIGISLFVSEDATNEEKLARTREDIQIKTGQVFRAIAVFSQLLAEGKLKELVVTDCIEVLTEIGYGLSSSYEEVETQHKREADKVLDLSSRSSSANRGIDLAKLEILSTVINNLTQKQVETSIETEEIKNKTFNKFEGGV